MNNASDLRTIFDIKATDANAYYSDSSYEFAEKIKLIRSALAAYDQLDAENQQNVSESHNNLQDLLDLLDSNQWPEAKTKLLLKVIEARTDNELAQDYDWLSRQRTLAQEAANSGMQSIANSNLLRQVLARIDEAIRVNQEFSTKRESRRTDLAHLIEFVIKARQGHLLTRTADGQYLDMRAETTLIEQQYSEQARALALKRFCLATAETNSVEAQAGTSGAPSGEMMVLDKSNGAFDMFAHLDHWLENPNERVLPAGKDLKDIRKYLHLGLMTLYPDKYLPRFSQKTTTKDYPDSLPDGFSLDPDYRVGKSDINAGQLEAAFTEALDLSDQITQAINLKINYDDDLAIDDSLVQVKPLYEAYKFYASPTVIAKIVKIEQPIRDVLREDGETIDNALAADHVDAERLRQLENRVNHINETLRKLRDSAKGSDIPPDLKQQNKTLQDRIKGWRTLIEDHQAQLKIQQQFDAALPGWVAEIEAWLNQSTPQAQNAKKRINDLFDEYKAVALSSEPLLELLEKANDLSNPQQAYEEMKLKFDTAGQRSTPTITEWQRVVTQGTGQFNTDGKGNANANVIQTRQRGNVLYLYASAVVQYLTCLDDEKHNEDVKAAAAIRAAHDLVNQYQTLFDGMSDESRYEIQDQIDLRWADTDLAQTVANKFETYRYWDNRIFPLIDPVALNLYQNRQYNEAYQDIRMASDCDQNLLRKRLLTLWIADVKQQAKQVAEAAASTIISIGLIKKLEQDTNILIAIGSDPGFDKRLPQLRENDNEIKRFRVRRLPISIDNYRSEHAKGLNDGRGPLLDGVTIQGTGVPLPTADYQSWHMMLEDFNKQDSGQYLTIYGDEGDEVGGYLQIRETYDTSSPRDQLGQMLNSRLSIPRRHMLIDAYLVICEAQILNFAMGSDDGGLLQEMRAKQKGLAIDLSPVWENRIHILSAYLEARIETLAQLINSAMADTNENKSREPNNGGS